MRASPLRSRTLRHATAAIAVVTAGAALAVPVLSPPVAAAQSTVLEGYYLLWPPTRDGWGRRCLARTPNGQVVTMPSGTVMETEEVVTNPDDTKTTINVRKRCVNGEWQPAP